MDNLDGLPDRLQVAIKMMIPAGCRRVVEKGHRSRVKLFKTEWLGLDSDGWWTGYSGKPELIKGDWVPEGKHDSFELLGKVEPGQTPILIYVGGVKASK